MAPFKNDNDAEVSPPLWDDVVKKPDKRRFKCKKNLHFSQLIEEFDKSVGNGKDLVEIHYTFFGV